MKLHKMALIGLMVGSFVSVNSFALASGGWQYDGAGDVDVHGVPLPSPSGEVGGETWAEAFNPLHGNGSCDGLSQSPINFSAGIADPLAAPVGAVNAIHYEGGDVIAENNGHTIQVNPNRSIVIDDAEYRLLQFHFHTKSEHTLAGVHSRLEMHFVHQKSGSTGTNDLAVLGVLIQEGQKEHKGFLELFGNFPGQPVAHHEIISALAANYGKFLPKDKTVYSYSGSLTTPPCSENVKWFVFPDSLKLSAGQIQGFQDMFKDHSGVNLGTNRPVQPLNSRTVGLGMTP